MVKWQGYRKVIIFQLSQRLLYFSIVILTKSFEMDIFGHTLESNLFDWVGLIAILSIMAICLLGCWVVNKEGIK